VVVAKTPFIEVRNLYRQQVVASRTQSQSEDNVLLSVTFDDFRCLGFFAKYLVLIHKLDSMLSDYEGSTYVEDSLLKDAFAY
jgi:hypothetical protein